MGKESSPMERSQQKPWRSHSSTRTFAWQLSILTFSFKKEMPTKRFSSLMSRPSGIWFSKSAWNSCFYTQLIIGGKQKSYCGGKHTLMLLLLMKKTHGHLPILGRPLVGSYVGQPQILWTSLPVPSGALQAEVTELYWWVSQCNRLTGCKKVGPTSEEEVARVWMPSIAACCTWDLFRHQNEFLVLATKHLVKRCSFRALSLASLMGMPLNQLGALTGKKYYHAEAAYFYQCSIHSGVPFKGASWNFKQLFDYTGKRYSHLERYQGKKLYPSQGQCWDNKGLLVSFLYLQRLFQPQREIQSNQVDGPVPVGSGRCSSLSFLSALPIWPKPGRYRGKASKRRLVSPRLPHLPHGGSLPHECAQPEENRLKAAQASGHLHRDVFLPSNSMPESKLSSRKGSWLQTWPSPVISKGEGQEDFPAACPGPHHSKSQKSHRSS